MGLSRQRVHQIVSGEQLVAVPVPHGAFEMSIPRYP